MLSFKPLTMLFLTLSLSSCSTLEVADVGPMVTLPASKDCYRVTTLTVVKTRIPKAECDEIKKRAVFFTTEDWRKQKTSILKNCQMKKCKDIVGVFDHLFLTIDEMLQKIPTVK